MLFKPTVPKVVASIILALALGYLLHGLFFPCKPLYAALEDGSVLLGDPKCAFAPFTQLPSFWALVFALAIMVYVIWSFVQKK